MRGRGKPDTREQFVERQLAPAPGLGRIPDVDRDHAPVSGGIRQDLGEAADRMARWFEGWSSGQGNRHDVTMPRRLLARAATRSNEVETRPGLGSPTVTDEPTISFLTDGGQTAAAVLDRLVAYIAGARESLDVAIYDAHLSPDRADLLLGAFAAAEQRGVRVRAVYNDLGPEPGHALPVPKISKATPQSGPSLLQRLTRSVPFRAISGIPDLMHHKYVIRDRAWVWTGSTNWTDDSWTRQENAIVVIPSADLAAAYQIDFDQLWTGGVVENSGDLDDTPADLTYQAAPLGVRALFSPGRGREISELIGRRITDAGTRINICSPVLTSAEVLKALVTRIEAKTMPSGATITIDGPQMHGAISQWKLNSRAAWKVPLAEAVLHSGLVAEKSSTPYAPGTPHDYMHAKMVVCDDIVVTGSFNCSHSGEMNAENVLEVSSVPFANECANFVTEVHRRYAR
jgi:phosphatidylserine/phosphatidylglycerophosphate/cardiolipin synthase-like enzyme